MKSIIKIFAIVMILSLIGCSLRKRSKVTRRTKNLGFANSELDVVTQQIAQKMCLKVGREATYVFFGNINAFINKTLPDRALYEKLFGRTFDEYRGADKHLIQKNMMTTAMAVLGGNSMRQIPMYWKEYALKMQRDNAAYLEGLVAASKGRGDSFKLAKDVTETGQKFVEHGSGAFSEIVADGLGVEGLGSMVTEKIIEVVIYLIQSDMLKNANSKFFTRQEIDHNDAFKSEIIKRGGSCGRPLPSTENDSDYLGSPYFLGDLSVLK